jgi:UDP-N-acetylmuramyl pentapeptide phosphotransferase/UDP-N-acetylglucosamine-1-phosphate transferase
VVSIFAILKVFNASAENVFWLNLARIFFVVAHLFMTIVFIRSTLKIDNNVGTAEKKSESRTKLRKSFGNIILRALIIAAIHWKTQMLQPLFVSSTLGLFTVAELDDLLKASPVSKKNN